MDRGDPGTLLPQLPLDALQYWVGTSHEGIKQSFFDTVRFPNGRWLEPNTFLGGRFSLVAKAVEDRAAAERSHLHVESDNGFRQVFLNLSPSDGFP